MRELQQRSSERLSRRVDETGDLWTLADAANLWRRQARLVLGVCCGCLLLATFYCLVATPRYQAKALVEIQKEGSSPLGLASEELRDAPSDALDYNVSLETQAAILNSDTLALQVIEQERLEQTSDYFGRSPGGFRLPQWVTFWQRPLEPLSIPLASAPNRRYVALKIFHSHLKVSPQGGTRLIEVGYLDRSPERSAAVVNALIQALIGYSVESRYAATAQASSWLSGQLTDLKRQTEALQEKAIGLQRATGMFGDDEAHNIVLSRLEALNQTLAAAESNRILKEAIYRTAASGDPELISGLSGNGAQSVGVQNSLSLIQTLRAQESSVKAEIALDQTRYGARYPKMAELESELTDVQKSTAEEVRRLGERARTDYEIAERAEAGARTSFEEQKAIVNQLNDKAVAYALTKQEADDSRNLYEGLLGKLKQAGILEGLASNSVNVVSPARTPPPDHPKSPNVPLYEAAALACGLFLGGCAAAVREVTDDRVRDRGDVERLIGASPLAQVIAQPRRAGLLSKVRGAGRRAPLFSQTSEYAAANSVVEESFALLRTALDLGRQNSDAKVLLVTSPCGGEGKSTIASELAATYGKRQASVLLVEADFRSLGSGTRFTATEHGLSAALSGKASETIFESDAALPALKVLSRGIGDRAAAERLGTQAFPALMQGWRASFDYIVIDGPAYLPVADGAWLAQQADTILVVLREGKTRCGDVVECLQTLDRQAPREAAIEVVLNGQGKAKGRGYAMA